MPHKELKELGEAWREFGKAVIDALRLKQIAKWMVDKVNQIVGERT